ncbi:hypothetical protein [Pseudoxanthomonas sp. PXM02]|uniref:hypothetical protein n=1 Tax=Pseudoxanthomonas sp. PXM02 TaxID=2769294 RepID=UPI001CE1A376|nr:hypothetical protein [Pseudoxanthomonas sp. PXM02]
MLTLQQTGLLLAACGLHAVAFGAEAQNVGPILDVPPAILADTRTPDVPIAAISELGRAIATDRLSTMRGGDASQTENLIDIDGSVDDNTAHHITSGSNSIADGAFNNASGINTVIQNTGSNVLIQNAMIVTVDFTGGPQ